MSDQTVPQTTEATLDLIEKRLLAMDRSAHNRLMDLEARVAELERLLAS